MSQYNKLIAAAVVGAVAILDHLYGPGSTASQVVLSVAAALGVYAVPNKPTKTSKDRRK